MDRTICCRSVKLESLSMLFLGVILQLSSVHASQQPPQVAGTINREFNASGAMITSTGVRLTGPNFFSGSLVVVEDVNSNTVPVITINQDNGKIVVVSLGMVSRELFIVVANKDGTLDTSFNPSGLTIDSVGNPIMAEAYSGLLSILSPVNQPFSSPDVAVDSEGKIYVAASLRPGTSSSFQDLFVIAINPDGTVCRDFNPLQLRANDNGSLTFDNSGYEGMFRLSLANLDVGPHIVIDESRNKLDIALATEAGKTASRRFNLAIVMLNPTGNDILDRSFNPEGYFITNTGAQIQTGVGYSGTLVIDLGSTQAFDSNTFPDISLDLTSNGRLFAAMSVNTGPGELNDIAIAAILPTGLSELLDKTFNPLGWGISSTGLLVPFAGGYSGAVWIDAGGRNEEGELKVDETYGRIVLATNTLDSLDSTASVLTLTLTGLLDSTFNPLGASVTPSGDLMLNGFPGILRYGDTPALNAIALSIQDGDDPLYIFGAGRTQTVNDRSLQCLAINPVAEQVVDRQFNPLGMVLETDGSETPGGVYAGALRAQLVSNSIGLDLAVNQADGDIITSTRRDAAPNSAVQLFSWHGRTILPPPPPLSPLFAKPFIVMSAQ